MSQIKASNLGATCTWCIKSMSTGWYVTKPEIGSQATPDISGAYLWLSEAAAQAFADLCGKTGPACVVVRARP